MQTQQGQARWPTAEATTERRAQRPGPGQVLTGCLGVGRGYRVGAAVVAVEPRSPWRTEEGHLQTESREGEEGLGLGLACDRENCV